MTKEKEYFAFISDKRKILPTVNCWPCPNLVQLRTSSGVPLVLFWLSYRALTWIRCAFLDEPNGRSTSGFPSKARLPIAFRLFPKGLKAEHEEGLKVMCGYTLTNN